MVSGVDTEPGLTPARRKSTVAEHLHHRIVEDISARHADLVLGVCFFLTGLIDAGAFEIYATFVGMQTGNTIFVALGAAGLPRTAPAYNWTKSLLAILCFSLGALFFASFHRVLGGTKRWVMVTSFGIEALMVMVVAIIVTTGAVTGHPPPLPGSPEATQTGLIQNTTTHFPWSDLIPVGLLAFQSAGQIVASRVLKVGSMPTVVVTSLLCDLFSDANLFTAPVKKGVERNRRSVGFFLLFLGGVAGGFISKSWAGFAGILWLATFLKFCLVVAWATWPAKKNTATATSTSKSG